MAYHQRNNDHYDRNSGRNGRNDRYHHNGSHRNNYNGNNNSDNHRYFNKSLPVYHKVDEIIDTVTKNRITLIVGETGSGKTTQIGQYLMSCSFNKGRQIICTQPRQVAATSVAHRVSHEQKTEVGRKVGYQVRLDKKTSDETQLVFMTEGTLLRIAMGKDETTGKSNLNKFSVIIIDEAHERTVNADLLMGFLKTVVKNPNNEKQYQDIDLRLVIMSATLDEKRFLRYFDNPKLVRVEYLFCFLYLFSDVSFFCFIFRTIPIC